MSEFPRNVIIVCGTHGEILNEVFEIPESIESIYKYNLAAPNTCAFVSGKTHEFTTTSTFLSCKPENVLTYIEMVDDVSKLRNSIDDAVKVFPNIDNTEDTRTIQIFFSKVVRLFESKYSLNVNSSNDEYLARTLNSQERGKMHRKVHFGPIGRREMVNKEYVICNPQDENSFEFNWTITAVNNNVDLLRATLDYNREIIGNKKARRQHHGEMSVTTSDILEYLASEGVRNVIMFDLTCSLFSPSLDDSETESLSFKSNAIGYGGNKNISKKNKLKKTNKSKNRKIRKHLKIKKNKTNKNKKTFTPLKI